MYRTLFSDQLVSGSVSLAFATVFPSQVLTVPADNTPFRLFRSRAVDIGSIIVTRLLDRRGRRETERRIEGGRDPRRQEQKGGRMTRGGSEGVNRKTRRARDRHCKHNRSTGLCTETCHAHPKEGVGKKKGEEGIMVRT